MFAAFRVQTLVTQAQSIHGASADDVRFDNLIDIRLGHISIPDRIWIHNDIWAVLALIEAARLICANASLEPTGGELLFKQLLQPGFSEGIAASAGMPRGTLVSTNKDMSLKFCHQTAAASLDLSSHKIASLILHKRVSKKVTTEGSVSFVFLRALCG